MKKYNIILLTVLLLLSAQFVTSQVKIANGAILEVGEQVYFNTENNAGLIINSGGTLKIKGYVRIDGDLSNSAGNSGLQILSDANGTGSLIQSSAGISASVQRYMPQTYYHYISSPISNQSISPEFINTISNPLPGTVDFYKFDEPSNLWINIKDNSGNLNTSFETSFVVNRGYAVAYSDDDYTKNFSGTLNYANQNVTLSKTPSTGSEGWNLVGNPFPATLATNTSASQGGGYDFLTINASVLNDTYTGVYFWDEAIEDYKTVNQASDASYIGVGQAFMIMTAANGNTLNINASMQDHGDAAFYKNGNRNISRFYCSIRNPNQESNEIMIAFMNAASDGMDKGYDARKLQGNQDLSLYTKLVQDDGGMYSIQSLPPLVDSVSVNLGLSVNHTGTYRFFNFINEDLPSGTDVFLEDKLQNIQLDMSKIDEYSFVTNQTGNIDDRFAIHFFKNQTGIDDVEMEASNFNVYYTGSELIIKYFNEEYLDAVVSLLNVSGQNLRIWKKQFAPGQTHRIGLNQAYGFYVVVIRTQNFVTTKKVLIHKF